MKNRNFIKNSMLLLLPVSLGLGVLLGVNKKSAAQVSASSYSVNSVPKNLDLNDYTESEVRSYYSNLNGLGSDELQGTNLLKNLKPILKNGQKYYSYTSQATTAVWQIYEIVDRDWEKSPASAIVGYDSSTNTVTGYTYGKSNTNVGSNPYIHALYVNRKNVDNQTRAWGNHNQDQWGINQEHIWAKSCGFNEETPAAGARGDLMHLWAGNGRVNGQSHSNYYYGYVDINKEYDDAGSYAPTLSGNLKGFSKTFSSSTYSVFEPQDCDKGDIARALFYMAARYNYLSGSDSDGIDAGNPNLEIVNLLNWTGPKSSSYTSSTTVKGQMGILQDLLEWNRIDPPDAWEIHRNNLLCRNYTHNRNPFIDFPEWAEYIWGKSENGSYNPTETGSANPTSDNINTFAAEGDPTVTSVTVSPDGLSLNLKGTKSATLTATVNGTNNPSQTVTWSSSDTNVATVSKNGVVTAKSTGSATITAKSSFDKSKTGECEVTVLNEDVHVKEVFLDKNVIELQVGSSETLTETFDPAGVTNRNVSWSSSNPSVATVNGGVVHAVSQGSATITVTTEDSDKTATCSVTVTPKENEIYTITYSDTFTPAFPTSSETVHTTDTLHTDEKAGISFKEQGIYKNSNYLMFSKDKGFLYNTSSLGTISSIAITYSSNTSVSGKIGVYFGSEEQSTYTTTSNQTVKGKSQTDIFTNDVKGNGYFQISTSNANVQITTIVIYLTSKFLSGIELDTTLAKTEYYIGDTFTYDGLVVTAYYDDETEEIIDTYDIESPDMSTRGEKTVTVTYSSVSSSYTIDVVDASDIPETTQRIVANSETNYFEPGSIYPTGSTTSATASCFGFDVLWEKNSGTALAYTYAQLRIYTHHSFKLTPKQGFRIKSVMVYTLSSDYASALGSTSLTNCTKTIDGYNVALSVTNTDNFVSFTNGAQSRVKYIEVTYEAIATYSLVTDAESLRTGDNVVFVGKKESAYYQATTKSGNYLRSVSSSAPVDNQIKITQTSGSFEINRSGSSIRFKDGSNGYFASYSSSDNYIKYETVDAATDASLFALTLDNAGRVTKLEGQDSSISRRFIMFNGSNLWFSCYSKTSTLISDYEFYIFKKTSQIDADVWSTTFLSETEDCVVSTWSSLGLSYNELSKTAKLEIINCVANKSLDYSKRSQAMARYEYILGDSRFNSGLDNFIAERGVNPARPNVNPIAFGDKTSSTVLIIALTIVFSGAVGGYFLIKSRKKEEI